MLFRTFGFRGEVIAGAIREKNWNFYEQSAVLIDRENEVVGRVGIGGKKSTVCLSLTGMGCKWIRDWARVYKQCAMLDAKITRVDCAHDDCRHRIGVRARHRPGQPPLASCHQCGHVDHFGGIHCARRLFGGRRMPRSHPWPGTEGAGKSRARGPAIATPRTRTRP
ncbi:TPA: hypothetical protein ACOENC_003769 [Stenotrophomonas maltophilia]